MDSIQMKIAKNAAQNWKQKKPTTLEEALGITLDSEVAAVQGISKALKLSESVTKQLVGTEDENRKLKRDGEIYVSDIISEPVASEKRKGIQRSDNKNKIILNILSTIHDAWVRNNPNNFLKPDRNKERQFVPLQLLNWEEVESDLIFLKPILEAARVEIDEEQLREEHEIQQKEYLIDHKIFSHEDLVRHLSERTKFYCSLDGLETQNGGNIQELLQNPEIAGKMADQIESKVSIKSREDLAIDIIKSESKTLDEVLWAETVATEKQFNEDKCPVLNNPITKREIMLSKLIGKPYPTYFLEGIRDDKHDEYRNEVRKARTDKEWSMVGRYEYGMATNQSLAKKDDVGLDIDKANMIEFGYDRSGDKMQGSINVSTRDLWRAGLDNQRMGIANPEIKYIKILPKDIVEADKHRLLTTIEMGEIKKSINKIREKVKVKNND